MVERVKAGIEIAFIVAIIGVVWLVTYLARLRANRQKDPYQGLSKVHREELIYQNHMQELDERRLEHQKKLDEYFRDPDNNTHPGPTPQERKDQQ